MIQRPNEAPAYFLIIEFSIILNEQNLKAFAERLTEKLIENFSDTAQEFSHVIHHFLFWNL